MRYGRVRKYCSVGCQYAAQVKPTASKTCERCNQDFTRKHKTSSKDWKRQRFCCQACAGNVRPEVDYGGLSQFEIAQRLGISVRRVQQIEARAKRKIRHGAITNSAIRELMCLAT
jgi:hypothetical protein